VHVSQLLPLLTHRNLRDSFITNYDGGSERAVDAMGSLIPMRRSNLFAFTSVDGRSGYLDIEL
jgi:hypothetical protein